MISFENKVIIKTIENLINGDDYRQEVVNAINVFFLDFTIIFFRKILEAKMNDISINLDWYKKTFINDNNLNTEDDAVYAGINKKTITNIYGSAKKNIVIDIANSNFDYLHTLISSLEETEEDKISVIIKISYKHISVELSLTESLLVINALATKKIAIRGGAWSSIGKKVEKPLIIKLCELCGVDKTYINSEIFNKDGSLDFDREVDSKLYNKDKSMEYRIEVKLMGRGNPENSDAVIARNTHIFIADTLSNQNKKQLSHLNVEYLELKNNSNIAKDFEDILKKLDIPFKK